MQVLRGLTELVIFQLIGSLISSSVLKPVPGPIVGLVLLLVFLCVRGELSASVEQAAGWLLRCMPLLLVPAAVGVMAWYSVIQPMVWALLIVLCVSLVPTMIFTGLLMQVLVKRNQRGGQ
ncbi:CidA/LrgA family protein [Pseudomonas kurunegalensis]|uniref:CidA/LrgA family protein n=1 Tax=Pseudomonas kurunegalensis TaxID=485880 RepID=UPI002363E90D|nr:CidA/LrgA family protein [Pseudomonas kurunegalensis]MDD2134558.1 CidA/LrgA family protein [Pseudomonas kurunegalensis]